MNIGRFMVGLRFPAIYITARVRTGWPFCAKLL